MYSILSSKHLLTAFVILNIEIFQQSKMPIHKQFLLGHIVDSAKTSLKYLSHVLCEIPNRTITSARAQTPPQIISLNYYINQRSVARMPTTNMCMCLLYIIIYSVCMYKKKILCE